MRFLYRKRDTTIPQRPLPARLNPQRNMNALGNVIINKILIFIFKLEW